MVGPVSDYELASEPADLTQGIGSALVVSPHLDDAVLSCADLLDCNPGSVVVTIFAGSPSARQPLTHTDREYGVTAADEAVAARREENLLALFLLEAEPVWLDFFESQYGPRPALSRLVDALGEQIGRHSPDTVVFPLAVGQDDHRLAAEACLSLCAGAPDRRWIAYADAPDHVLPGMIEARGRELRSRGFALDPLKGPPASACKRHALDCCSSHLQALAAAGQAPIETHFAREQYWQIRRSA